MRVLQGEEAVASLPFFVGELAPGGREELLVEGFSLFELVQMVARNGLEEEGCG